MWSSQPGGVYAGGSGDRGLGYGFQLMRSLFLCFAATAALAVAGCGSYRSEYLSGGQNPILGGSAGYYPFQPRDQLARCLARLGERPTSVGRYSIVLSPAATSPRLFVAIDADAASAMQVRGEAEGAYVAGRVVVWVNGAKRWRIDRIDQCL
jgi:hypothetical protein